jgi:hypothetical protein
VTIQHIWIRESFQKQGQNLDLATSSSDVENGVTIISSGLMQKTGIRRHRTPDSDDVAALHGGEYPVLRSRSTAHALPHLSFS